jgi:hypothetical protein
MVRYLLLLSCLYLVNVDGKFYLVDTGTEDGVLAPAHNSTGINQQIYYGNLLKTTL